MIRLSLRDEGAPVVTLVVEGRVDERSTPLVWGACTDLLDRGRKVRIEGSSIVYADRRGIETLRVLQDRGVELVGCPSFLRESLRENPQSPRKDDP